MSGAKKQLGCFFWEKLGIMWICIMLFLYDCAFWKILFVRLPTIFFEFHFSANFEENPERENRNQKLQNQKSQKNLRW